MLMRTRLWTAEPLAYRAKRTLETRRIFEISAGPREESRESTQRASHRVTE